MAFFLEVLPSPHLPPPADCERGHRGGHASPQTMMADPRYISTVPRKLHCTPRTALQSETVHSCLPCSSHSQLPRDKTCPAGFLPASLALRPSPLHSPPALLQYSSCISTLVLAPVPQKTPPPLQRQPLLSFPAMGFPDGLLEDPYSRNRNVYDKVKHC